MKNLSTFSRYLRQYKLQELAAFNVEIFNTMDMPLGRFIPDMEEKQLIDFLKQTFEKLLCSFEDGTALEKTKANILKWQEDKLPGISKYNIAPSDIILMYSLQKKSLMKFVFEYTSNIEEAVGIVNELMDYFMQSQGLSFQTLFEIHKETETQLKEREERYHELFENAQDSIIVTDTRYRITEWNNAAEKLLGYSKEEAINQTTDVIIRFKFPQSDKRESIREVIRQKGHWDGELVILNKKGEELHTLISGSAIKNNLQQTLGSLFIIKDISDRRKMEIELQRNANELARSNKELEQFAYIASHDLQEPLRMISSYVQLLAVRYKDKLDQDAAEFIHYAVDGSNRLRILINSLLEYSRINRKKVFKMVNMNTIVEEVKLNIADTIKEANASIKYIKLPTVVADHMLMSQLLQNLISNAIKFKSDKQPEIFISAKKVDECYLFSVSDNGIGIKKDYTEKIFVIFQRLHTIEKYPGTGIGLAICKKIVEHHGGEIWVESEVGKGSTFYFTIKVNIQAKLNFDAPVKEKENYILHDNTT